MKPLLPAVLASLLLATAGASYTNAEYKFTATTPKGWKQLSYPGTLVVFAGAPSGGFAPNINVTVEKLPAGITLKQYEEAGRANMKKVITNFKFLGRRDVTLNGVPAVEQTVTGRQGQFDLYFTQTIAVKSNQAYVLTGTSLQNLRAGLIPVMSGFVKTFTFQR
ncbi:DcrB-related protein [Deinococcus altitudinis]|uniref:DcrB-related protein n=1 Tax=Deinococcus altitudinis TaxID=468914 RepID=UPI0038911F84